MNVYRHGQALRNFSFLNYNTYIFSIDDRELSENFNVDRE